MNHGWAQILRIVGVSSCASEKKLEIKNAFHDSRRIFLPNCVWLLSELFNLNGDKKLFLL